MFFSFFSPGSLASCERSTCRRAQARPMRESAHLRQDDSSKLRQDDKVIMCAIVLPPYGGLGFEPPVPLESKKVSKPPPELTTNPNHGLGEQHDGRPKPPKPSRCCFLQSHALGEGKAIFSLKEGSVQPRARSGFRRVKRTKIRGGTFCDLLGIWS